MNPELNKITFYFTEVKRLWPVDPERAISREFYELWEEIQQPHPFLVIEDQLTLGDQTLNLPVDDSESIGYYHWDNEEMCASLVVTNEKYRQKFLIIFNDGDPSIEEIAPVLLEADDLSHGERLEIIYDVIASVHEKNPARNVIELTKKEYLKALQDIEPQHEKANIVAMRRMTASFIKALLRNAAEDMALDELSSQLSLPLDGSYAATTESRETGIRSDDSPGRGGGEYQIPSRTRYEITSQVDFLLSACQFAADMEKKFVLFFRDARIIGDENMKFRDIPVKLPAEPDMPIKEGELLKVFRRGESESIGTFKVDLFDSAAIYGRLRGNYLIKDGRVDDQLFSKSISSPTSYLAAGLEELYRQLQDKNCTIPGVLNSVIGLESAGFQIGTNNNAPPHLDKSQKRAWTCAINPNNSTVLIQGPPGTGKTSVLVEVVRELCRQGKRILVTAPSHTAVDNICTRIFDLPLLRLGHVRNVIAPDVADRCWAGETSNIYKYAETSKNFSGGGIHAGTHVGILKSQIIAEDMKVNGLYDVIIFDEAGMARVDEFFLCILLSKRTVLFGDHQQLPPFPLPIQVLKMLEEKYQVISSPFWSIIKKSALEWLADFRDIPIIMLQRSYRCHNPRLLRFSSTLFYDAGVKPSEDAEYFKLSYFDRQRKYPDSTLMLYCTSGLPEAMRQEKIVFEGEKPGLENILEADVCMWLFYQLVTKYPLSEITIIAPYRRQIRLLRKGLSIEKVRRLCPEKNISEQEWKHFIFTRIATVDSFQGGESDVVIISYVRSNNNDGIGFVDEPNRINVAHTRCRREMIIIGDMICLKKQAKSNIFHRMERAFGRDGKIVYLDEKLLQEMK